MGEIEPVSPCPDCGSTSPFHRRHPITDREVDYEHLCRTCVHETRRGSSKRLTITCAQNPRYVTPEGQSRQAYPACILYRPDRAKTGTNDPIEAYEEEPAS